MFTAVSGFGKLGNKLFEWRGTSPCRLLLTIREPGVILDCDKDGKLFH
jgi:hypothetical protein